MEPEEMMEGQKMCPLVKDLCIFDSCAWWQEDLEKCSIAVIAEKLFLGPDEN